MNRRTNQNASYMPHTFFFRQYEGIRSQVALAQGPCTAYLFDFVNEFCQILLLSSFLFPLFFFCFGGMISTKAIIQVKAATQSCYSKQMPKIATAAQPRKLFASSGRAAVATCFVSFFVLVPLFGTAKKLAVVGRRLWLRLLHSNIRQHL